MPVVTSEEYKKLIEELFKSGISLSLTMTKEDEKEAEKNANYYIKNNKFNKKTPLTMYFIITKLDDKKKIEFIKEHIDYIREHDEEVFIYNMLSPRSLSYFLTIDTLKRLREIDKDIFKKVVTKNHENLFHGFSHEQYIEFYRDFKEDIEQTNNIEFINSIHHHNRCCYDSMDLNRVNQVYTLQKIYNKEFIDFLLEAYKDKIDSFDGKELSRFLNHIDDLEKYKELLNKYHSKLEKLFNEMDSLSLSDYLDDTPEIKQELLIQQFYASIIKKEKILSISNNLSINIIINLYKENKDLFSEFKLIDWIKLSSRKKVFNDDLKSIIDEYEITNIEELFDTKFYITTFYREDNDALKYIESKYRNALHNVKLNQITKTTSIFSQEFIENLTYLNEHKISTEDPIYQIHLSNFINFLKIYNIVTNINDKVLKELNNLFQKIIKGSNLAIIYELSNIEEITLLNRIGSIDFKVEHFTIEQIERYNVKNHKHLCELLESSHYNKKDYKALTLKLMLLVGFQNAKKILKINHELPVLEHLVGNVDVKNINLDQNGKPILNQRIINMIFNDNKVCDMLSNQDCNLYKYFPRIFNEWEMIQINDKSKSLNTIIEFLKSDDISLPPEYYRLEGLFKFIGCNNRIVKETLSLHDEMIKRTSSSIPRITGEYKEYTYEIMRLDDFESLAVGNKTDCCFTVLGAGYQCLKHALTSKNGRVFVVKKDDQIIAHSWIWRNGNLLCFDNIEISKSLNEVNFLDIYLNSGRQIIETSCIHEGIQNGITNITIGYTNFDKNIIGLENYPCLISDSCNLMEKNFGSKLGQKRSYLSFLPKPLEEVSYSDSKNAQYLILGSADIKSFEPEYLYQDEREETLYYDSNKSYDKIYIKRLNKIINSLRYIKYKQEDKLNEFKMLDIEDTNKIYCNVDWYIIEFEDGYIEEFTYSYDQRSELEKQEVIKNKTLIRK